MKTALTSASALTHVPVLFCPALLQHKPKPIQISLPTSSDLATTNNNGNYIAPNLDHNMCLCKCEPIDEEIVVPNRPRGSGPVSALSHSGHNISSLPSELEAHNKTRPRSRSRPRTAEIRRRTSRERPVLVETIIPRSSDSTSQRTSRPLSIGGPDNPHQPRRTYSLSPQQSRISIITPRQSGSVVRPPVYSRRQSTASCRSPRQSATTIHLASYRSTREKIAEVDDKGLRTEYDRRHDPGRR